MPPARSRRRRGFSLIELLMALAVISTIAAVAIVSLSGSLDAGKEAAALRNAQQFCELHTAARAAGVEFTAQTPAGLLDELIRGRRGTGQFASSEFRLPLDDDQKRPVLRLCVYDPVTGIVTLRRRLQD